MNPATKQMLIFSFVISLIASAVINFLIVEILKTTFLYGFPINLASTSGIGTFLSRVINTVVVGIILLPAVFYGVKYLQSRVRI